MKIIVLTNVITSGKIYVRVDKIVAVYEHSKTHDTVVQMVGDCGFEVKETPLEVVEMMHPLIVVEK